MSKSFNLNRYNKDRNKSYNFCQDRKTMEEDVDPERRKSAQNVANVINALRGKDISDVQRANLCGNKDLLGCCTLKLHRRVKSECKVCTGNV